MAEPHTIGSPQQALLRVADRVCEYYESEAFSNFVTQALFNNWNLIQSRKHIYYSLLELEWRLRPGLDCNPDRWFLSTLAYKMSEDEYEMLHPSLRFCPRLDIAT
jgi:hypothetical protein